MKMDMTHNCKKNASVSFPRRIKKTEKTGFENERTMSEEN